MLNSCKWWWVCPWPSMCFHARAVFCMILIPHGPKTDRYFTRGKLGMSGGCNVYKPKGTYEQNALIYIYIYTYSTTTDVPPVELWKKHQWKLKRVASEMNNEDAAHERNRRGRDQTLKDDIARMVNKAGRRRNELVGVSKVQKPNDSRYGEQKRTEMSKQNYCWKVPAAETEATSSGDQEGTELQRIRCNKPPAGHTIWRREPLPYWTHNEDRSR